MVDAWIPTDPVQPATEVWAPPGAGGAGSITLYAPDAIAEGGVGSIPIIQLTAPDALAEGGTGYRALTFIFPTVYSDVIYMYENVGFTNNPTNSDTDYMYENIGFLILPVNSDAYSMYENVGFAAPWTREVYGWGVPMNSDYTAMDSWYYLYENVTT